MSDAKQRTIERIASQNNLSVEHLEKIIFDLTSNAILREFVSEEQMKILYKFKLEEGFR